MENNRAAHAANGIPNTSTSGVGYKRKREPKNTLKFYAVRIGRTPGIYHSWADCLEQVQQFPKAIFKSFTSLSEAENFVTNETGSLDGKGNKWYGVQAGRAPGVYTSWQDVQDQITGWKRPKYKGFKSRAEAEHYVAEGKVSALAAGNVAVGSIEPSEPALKKAKSGKSKKGNKIKDEGSPTPLFEQGEYEPGEAPLLPDGDDGFDPTITIDHTINGARYKTREEREKIKYQATGPAPDTAIRIYTDGSSLGNGKAAAMGGIGVYFGPGDGRNLSEPLTGSRHTNQRAELTAVVRALEVAPKDRKIVIVSDSKYAIDCVTDWFQNWQRNGWVNAAKRPVENKDLVQKIVDQLDERLRLNRHRMDEEADVPVADKRSHWDRGPGGVRFEWVKGHDKDEGNAAADVLAVAGARTAQDLNREVKLDD